MNLWYFICILFDHLLHKLCIGLLFDKRKCNNNYFRIVFSLKKQFFNYHEFFTYRIRKFYPCQFFYSVKCFFKSWNTFNFDKQLLLLKNILNNTCFHNPYNKSLYFIIFKILYYLSYDLLFHNYFFRFPSIKSMFYALKFIFLILPVQTFTSLLFISFCFGV